MTEMNNKWVIVQHSGFGYKGDPRFEQALETRKADTKRLQNAITKLGGLMFDSWIEAENFTEEAMYPDPEYRGMVPQARGTFSDKRLDGLAIYIPVREVMG